jgi:Domain of unknown function (DUF2024)
MKVAVYDTYVTKKDGSIMHFDIIVLAENKNITDIHNFGQKYLSAKKQEGQPLTAKECQFCHIEEVKPAWKEAVEQNGYYIYEMEGCN